MSKKQKPSYKILR